MVIRKLVLAVLAVAGMYACDDILEVSDISQQEVDILAPKEGSVITDTKIRFNWNKIEEATSYRVQIAKPTFEEAIQILLDSIIIEDSLGSVRTSIEVELTNGRYQWRIKAINGGYETVYNTNSFEVQGDENTDSVAPNTPMLIAPSDGSSQDETAVTFSWSREDIAGTTERDSIYIYTDMDLQTLETKGMGANKTYTVNLTSNTYYWVVKVFDDTNESESSTVFEFTIN
ncbi:hypothetical protein SB49_14140 [Sediminicola sp. YIK13]|uniref:hypothetical protein n=1 Tax=Sediminicola sp. YIK13 TaxID=1453352 RepID=UPI000720EB18|nr:hypothetical protein [Sediminicola sp. YIK13]ALM08808.1 hypothetical protein SB49_14140 [Sediminicola sp. YIK13]